MPRTYDHNARIVHQENLNESLRVLRVAPLEGEAPSFEPGQYGELAVLPDSGADHGVVNGDDFQIFRRPFSIASAPSERGYLEFLIVLVDGGRFTSQLWNLQEGDTLWMGNRVKGLFTLNEIADGVEGKNLITISTGTGIAPFMSMWRNHRHQKPWRKFVMINGVRMVHDLAYRDELEAGHRDDDDFVYIPMVTREAWDGHSGRVTSLFEDGRYEQATGEELTPENTHFFLCGNPAMIEQMEEILTARGFKLHKRKDPGNIHFERYW